MKRTFGVIAGAVLGLVSLSAGAFLYPTGNVIQGIYLGEQDVSRADKEELVNIIEEEAAKAPTHMTVKWQNGKETKVALADIGIKPNVNKTIESIMAYGYEPTMEEYINSRWQALVNPVSKTIVYDVNVPALEALLQTYNKEIAKSGHDAYLTVDGGKVVLHKEVAGQRLDIAKTIANLQEQLVKGEVTTMSLVIDEQAKPKITTEDLKGINAVLGTYSTTFNSGDTSRTHNIQLATDKINNVVIQPHQNFSFNVIVGERTAEAGYDDAPVFMDGKLVPGIGGGICQVSSTLFNTALLSGMTIEERVPHYAPVGYIPAGRDATVAYGYIDFVFSNPYEHPIYVLAHTEGDTLTISILGFAADEPTQASVVVGGETAIPHETQVTIDPSLTKEEVKQAGHDGLSVNTTVQLTYKDGRTKTDSFNSTYDPETTIVVKPNKEVTTKQSDSKDNAGTANKEATKSKTQ
ncbi:VanW family protein [Veillonella sp. R32]|uniref:VanW family protein n=1 Tax=Veillonella sp. R32 TaxID=2021312 RepID=UPI0013895FB4|nr:VanW family protein [Veillonella sp. R32]KAF1681389.1 vancomycin resistance protein [Veillonella sp. R32]